MVSMVDIPALLAQTPAAPFGPLGAEDDHVFPLYPMMLGAALLVLISLGTWYWLHRNRALREHRQYLAQKLGLTELDMGDGEFRFVHQRLNELALCVATFDLNVQYAAVGKLGDWRIELIDVGNMWAALTNVGQTIVILRDDAMDLPAFVLVPSNYLMRKMSGEKARQFAEDAIFSKNNRLHIGYRNARGLFTEPIRVALRTNRKLTIEGLGDRLAFYQFGYRTRPDDLEPFIEQCRALADMIRASGRREVA